MEEPSVTLSPSRDQLVAAALARLSSPLSADQDDEVLWAKEREQRQQFRRLVDPGIVRGNNEAVANMCIECLLTICQNILDHPEDEKYRKFRPNNKTIRHKLVEPKGGLEFATALGFREHVEQFEPYYLWRPTEQNVVKLRIGAFVLKEHNDKVLTKEASSKETKMTLKEAQEETARRVKLAFEDDRKTMALKQKMERESRMASNSTVPAAPRASPPSSISQPQSPTSATRKED